MRSMLPVGGSDPWRAAVETRGVIVVGEESDINRWSPHVIPARRCHSLFMAASDWVPKN